MKKIVLIEDEETLKDLLNRKLEENGYDVVVASDGEQGVEKIKEHRPDLILLDIMMPNKDGFQVMEEVKQDETLSEIPIIIISNSGQPVEVARAQELGAKDWIIKTEFDPQEVLEMVVEHLGEN